MEPFLYSLGSRLEYLDLRLDQGYRARSRVVALVQFVDYTRDSRNGDEQAGGIHGCCYTVQDENEG